jgi:hypothetical protein
MSATDDKDRAFIAKFAFVLFIAGLLLPFAIAAGVLASAGWPRWEMSPYTENFVVSLAFGFGFIAEILALTLGVVSRRTAWGRAAIVGAAIAVTLGLILTAARPLLPGFPGRIPPPQPKTTPSVPVTQKQLLPPAHIPKNAEDAARLPVSK